MKSLTRLESVAMIVVAIVIQLEKAACEPLYAIPVPVSRNATGKYSIVTNAANN